jgi:DNA repair protein RAD7
MSRKRSARSEETNEPIPSRRATQRSVAETSVPRFARPEVEPAHNEDNRDDTRRSWPGPFSTAMRMIEEREEAKRQREIMIASKQSGTASNEEIELDVYDQMLLECMNKSVDTVIYPESAAPVYSSRLCRSLIDRCIDVLAEKAEPEDSLDLVPTHLKGSLALGLSKRRRLSSDFLRFVISDSSSVVIPDCSSIDEASLKSCFEPCFHKCLSSTLKFPRIISLHNCGACLTSAMVEYLIPILAEVEIMTLHGCYRLNDDAFSQIIEVVQRVRCLNFSCCLKIGTKALSSMQNLQLLTEICLDNNFHLCDDDIRLLCIPNLSRLCSVSLCGLNITDSAIEALALSCGSNLRSLNISLCTKLSDKSLSSLYMNCQLLNYLDISSIPLITHIGLAAFFSNSTAESKIARSEFKSLNLSGLPCISDDILISACIMSSNSLGVLNIQGCHALTSKAVMGLVMHCGTCLVEFNMSFIRNFNTRVLAQLIQRSTCLETIHAWGCSQIDRALYSECSARGIDLVGYIDRYS